MVQIPDKILINGANIFNGIDAILAMLFPQFEINGLATITWNLFSQPVMIFIKIFSIFSIMYFITKIMKKYKSFNILKHSIFFVFLFLASYNFITLKLVGVI